MANTFKVIISGGGPAGLVAAHSLHLAGIDFVVLEQREDPFLDSGAGVALFPQSLRVLYQFGLYDQINNIGAQFKQRTGFTADGHLLGHFSFAPLVENHGSAPVVFHRSELLQTLYDGLPKEAQARILTGKKVSNVESDEESVKVTCTDGSLYQGSVLIGADGVHSKTRHHMRRLALQSDAGLKWDAAEPFTSVYKGLWCSFPPVTEAGEVIETHGKDRSIMYFGGKSRAFAYLFSKLPEPTNARTSYTEDDITAFAEEFADLPITSDVSVRDIFAKRITAGMSNLEEGVAENWNWGRIALVGDACHKYTPNGGLGLNNGIQDVVTLCNGLSEAFHAAQNGSPSLSALTNTFQTYQAQRRDLAKADWAQSIHATKEQISPNLFYLVLGRYIMWFAVVQYILLNWIAPQSIRKGRVLNYVPGKERLNGSVSWTHPMKERRLTVSHE